MGQLNTMSAMGILANLLDAAENRMREFGGSDGEEAGPVAICIMGADMLPICMIRMDNVQPAALQTAEDKATTALLYRRNTRDFIGWSAADCANARSVTPTFVNWAGGVLIYDEHGEIVGAIGVSGLSEDADHELAIDAANSWEKIPEETSTGNGS